MNPTPGLAEMIHGKPSDALEACDVLVSSYYLTPGESTWNSGFSRLADHQTFSLRRPDGPFGRFRGEDRSLPVERELDRAYFGGVLFPYYGHFVIESLSMLPNIPAGPEPIIFKTLRNTVRNWQLELFDYIGIGGRVVFTHEQSAIRTGTLLKVPQTTMINSHIAADFVDFFRRFARPARRTDRRIYISRMLCRNAYVTGMESLEECLAGMGFEIVYPELLTIAQQIETYSEAAFIVSIEGSALHTLVFCDTPKTVAILQRRHSMSVNFGNHLRWQPRIRAVPMRCMKEFGKTFNESAVLDVPAAIAQIRRELAHADF